MLYRLLLLICILSGATATAQWRISGVELSTMPAIGLHRYTNDSLVFERRRKQGTISSSAHNVAMMHIQHGSSRSSLFAGIGLRDDEFIMNTFNLSDGLLALLTLPNIGNRDFDTFAISRIQFTSTSITMPLAYAYDLTKTQTQAVHFLVRALFVPGFAVSRRAQVYRNETPVNGVVLSDDEIRSLSALYGQHIAHFSLVFAPEINLTTGYRKWPVGINLGLQPFAFDLVKPTSTFLKGITYVRFSFGLTYHWNR